MGAALARAIGRAGFEPSLASLVERRATDLSAYQSQRYASGYVREVCAVHNLERARMGSGAGQDGRDSITGAYARGLYKLMAYKDEYEVACLHLDSVEIARRDEVFGPGAQVEVLLSPPALTALGLRRKIRLRRAAEPLFRALRPARRLRGTRADPFGRTTVRRVERALVGEYRELVHAALEELRPDTHERVRAIVRLPDLVRGYEQIKLDNVERYRNAAAVLLGEPAAIRRRPFPGPGGAGARCAVRGAPPTAWRAARQGARRAAHGAEGGAAGGAPLTVWREASARRRRRA